MKELIETRFNILAAQNGLHTCIGEFVEMLNLGPNPRPTKSENAL